MSRTSGGSSDGVCVLCVDDDPGFADVVAATLEREAEAIDAVAETDPRDALDRLDDDPVDCVVSDYQMPDLDGLEFLARIRESHPDLPFILFTGKGSEEIASEAISAGVTDYLQKETGTEQFAILANRVTNAVEQVRSRRDRDATERRLAQLAESTNDALWMFSADWEELLFVNSAYEDLWGRSVEALADDPHDFLAGVHPDDRDDARAAMDALSNGESADLEFRLVDDDGRERVVWAQGEPVFDGDDVVQTVGFVTDLTDRTTHERTLSALHNVAVELEASDSPDAVYERSIRAAEDLLEFDYAVLAVEHDGVLEVEATTSEFPEGGTMTMPVDEGVAGRTYRTGESALIRDITTVEEAQPKGPYRSGVSVPIGEHGNFQAISEAEGSFDDHDLELAELLMSHTASALDRLARERRLERQNDRLDEFVGIVSHDLRNPVTVAGGTLALLRETCTSPHLDRLEHSLERMEQIIEQTLALAREGAVVDEMAPVDVGPVARRAVQTVETDGAAVAVDVDVTVEADEHRLQHVFENLVRNAVEHGTHDAHIRVGPLDDGFYVADDGPGIPEADRERVFDPGFSTADGGTGFGLAIVGRIVEAHGWTVRVTESDAGGARFEITGVDVVDEAPARPDGGDA